MCFFKRIYIMAKIGECKQINDVVRRYSTDSLNVRTSPKAMYV